MKFMLGYKSTKLGLNGFLINGLKAYEPKKYFVESKKLKKSKFAILEIATSKALLLAGRTILSRSTWITN